MDGDWSFVDVSTEELDSFKVVLYLCSRPITRQLGLRDVRVESLFYPETNKYHLLHCVIFMVIDLTV